jgi:hypothetical protein
MENLAHRIDSILQDMYSSIYDMKLIGIIDFELGLSLEIKNTQWKKQEGLISAVLSEIGRFIQSKEASARNPAKRDTLKNYKKLMIETEEAFIIISKIENTKFGIIAVMGKEGNLGLLLSKIKLASSNLIKVLT